jgi:hypothetical protein
MLVRLCLQIFVKTVDDIYVYIYIHMFSYILADAHDLASIDYL